MLRLAALLVFMTSPLCAVVVNSGNNDGDWWREGQTAPLSFGALDANTDGTVSQDEMATARKQFATALKETKSSLLAAVDSDNSGKLSRYEGAEAKPRWVSLRERAREMAFALYDKNLDRVITEDESIELEKHIGQVFVRNKAADVDQDRDKNFSRTEVKMAIKVISDGKEKFFSLCDVNKDGELSTKEVSMAFDLLAAAVGIVHL